MKAFSPLGGDVISKIRGLASGRARVTGDYRNPDIDGEILLREAGLGIPYFGKVALKLGPGPKFGP